MSKQKHRHPNDDAQSAMMRFAAKLSEATGLSPMVSLLWAGVAGFLLLAVPKAKALPPRNYPVLGLIAKRRAAERKTAGINASSRPAN